MNKLTQRIILLLPLLLVLTTFSAAYSSEKSPRLFQLQQLEKAAFSGNFPKNHSLKNIDTTRMSQEEKALYILIQTKIALKTQNISLHDTLLHIPIRYFKAQKDAKRLAESYYLQGEIYRLNHFFSELQIAMIRLLYSRTKIDTCNTGQTSVRHKYAVSRCRQKPIIT